MFKAIWNLYTKIYIRLASLKILQLLCFGIENDVVRYSYAK